MSRNFIRKTWITVAGITVILVGIALLVLPGPGLVTIAAGLAILASEFDWARRALSPIKKRLDRAKDRFRD